MTRYYVQRGQLSDVRHYGADVEMLTAKEHDAEIERLNRALAEAVSECARWPVEVTRLRRELAVRNAEISAILAENDRLRKELSDANEALAACQSQAGALLRKADTYLLYWLPNETLVNESQSVQWEATLRLINQIQIALGNTATDQGSFPCAETALKNCMLLAARHRKETDSDWMHIIRFCKEGGVDMSPLREPLEVPR
jgi:hypothetical protein